MQRILKTLNTIRDRISKLDFTTTVIILTVIILVVCGAGLLISSLINPSPTNPITGNNSSSANASGDQKGLLPDPSVYEPDQLHPQTPDLPRLREVLPYSGLNYSIAIDADENVTISYKSGQDGAYQSALIFLRDYGVDISYAKLKTATY